MMRFLNIHGSWFYVEGNYVKRMRKGGKLAILFRTRAKQEYPEHWVKDELTEKEKSAFVRQWNERYKERVELQAAIHPEDREVLLPYKPLSFEEIIQFEKRW